MALNPQQFQQLQERLGGKASVGSSQSTQQVAQQPSYLQRLGQSYKDTAKNIISDVARPDESRTKGAGILETAKQVGEAGLRTVGNVSKAAFAPITEAIAPTISPAIQKIASLPGISGGIKVVSDWASKHPEAAKDLDAVFNIATLGGGGAAEKPIKDAVGSAVKKTATAVGEGASAVASKVGSVTSPITKEIGRIPSRIATNVAEKQAVEKTIQELPGPAAQNAARDGIDIGDIKTLTTSVTKDNKPLIKNLFDTFKSFASKTSRTHPFEAVGKPIVSSLKKLEALRGAVGKKLGTAAEGLGRVVKEEVEPVVFGSLQKAIPGLKKTMNGVLDFSDTVLNASESLAERKAIRKVFEDAIKSGTGIQKHRLRQGLFEIIGGAKRSAQSLTATKESAYDAIRSGLSDVLETKSTGYKALNQTYAKLMKPLGDMRKVMKYAGTNADEDILSMSAGLLARRLTSHAASNPQVRAILRNMDDVLKSAGRKGAEVNTEVLQDVYNVLNRYYDVAGKTSFEGGIKSGIEKATTITGELMSRARDFAGESVAVRQKALEKLLQELLR